MPSFVRPMFHYIKSVLEKVSFDVQLFKKERKKAIQSLLPYELEELRKWLLQFTTEKPELKPFVALIP
jgi:DNA replication protein DnaD